LDFWDGADANFGYFIEGKGAFQSSPFSPDAALPFWGNADGSPVQSFYFQSDGESQVVNVLVAGGLWSPFSSLGWYDPNSNAWGWIIDGDGSTAVGQSIAFTRSPITRNWHGYRLSRRRRRRAR